MKKSRGNNKIHSDKLKGYQWHTQWQTQRIPMTHTVTNSKGTNDPHNDKLKGYQWNIQWQTKHIRVRGTVTLHLQFLISSHVHWFCLKNGCPLMSLAPRLPSLLSLQCQQRINNRTATASVTSLTHSPEILISTSWHLGSYQHPKGTAVNSDGP